MYTIGQISDMFDLPISTLRYYDKEGFFPDIERKGNIRYFSDTEIEVIHVIKCWYYDKAIADGNENGINAMLPDKLPKEIQKLYNKAHE